MHYWINQYAHGSDVPGGTRHFEFARMLCKMGIRTDVVASDLHLATRAYFRRVSQADRRPIREQIADVTFHWLYARQYEVNNWRRAVSMARFGETAWRYLMRVPVTRDTTFIGSSPHLFAALAAERAARLRRLRFVLEVRDLWPESLIEVTGREGTVAKGLRVIADHLYRRADRIIVLAKQNADVIVARGIPKDRLVYIPNSVDPGAANDPAPIPFELPKDKILAVYCGAHGQVNDLDGVLEAARYLKQLGRKDIQILLVGDGVEKKRLVERANSMGLDNVAFKDSIPKETIPTLLRSCHIGLMTLQDIPLFQTGVSPNKLFDYMAASLPVVTNVGGECAEIVSSTGCGLAVTPGDPRSLAKGIAEVASKNNRKELGEAGAAYVLKHHNRARLVDKLAEVVRG